MLAVKGIFAGASVKILEKRIPAEPRDVIITFLGAQEANLQKGLYALSEKGGSFDFLVDEEEIYSEKDLKTAY